MVHTSEQSGIPTVQRSEPLPWDRVRLSVVVPVYNERETVEAILRRVREVPLDVEVIVVDDASTDGTRELLPRLEEEGLIDELVLQDHNQGKGAALREGFRVATGDVVVVQDADMEYDPHELPALLEPILEGRADAVYGSRFLGGPHRVLFFWHMVGNRLLTLLSNMLTDLNLTDMETCYKMVRRDLLGTLPLRADRFGFEPEVTARLAQSGARIFEQPISYYGRSYAEGKKIGWKDGVAALWYIVRFNLLSRKAPRWEGPREIHLGKRRRPVGRGEEVERRGEEGRSGEDGRGVGPPDPASAHTDGP